MNLTMNSNYHNPVSAFKLSSSQKDMGRRVVVARSTSLCQKHKVRLYVCSNDRYFSSINVLPRNLNYTELQIPVRQRRSKYILDLRLQGNIQKSLRKVHISEILLNILFNPII